MGRPSSASASSTSAGRGIDPGCAAAAPSWADCGTPTECDVSVTHIALIGVHASERFFAERPRPGSIVPSRGGSRHVHASAGCPVRGSCCAGGRSGRRATASGRGVQPACCQPARVGSARTCGATCIISPEKRRPPCVASARRGLPLGRKIYLLTARCRPCSAGERCRLEARGRGMGQIF